MELPGIIFRSISGQIPESFFVRDCLPVVTTTKRNNFKLLIPHGIFYVDFLMEIYVRSSREIPRVNIGQTIPRWKNFRRKPVGILQVILRSPLKLYL